MYEYPHGAWGRERIIVCGDILQFSKDFVLESGSATTDQITLLCSAANSGRHRAGHLTSSLPKAP